MNYLKKKILERKIEILNKENISFNQKPQEFFKKINKKEFEYLMNNEELCKKIFYYFILFGAGDSGMWNARARSFIESLIKDIFILKKTNNINIKLPLFCHYLILSNIVDLNQYLTEESIPLKDRGLWYYLKNLSKKTEKIDLNNAITQEQHCYVSMQFTANLSKFMDYYEYSTEEGNKYKISRLKLINKIKRF